MKLTKFQFYTKNISICLGIVNILSTRIQDHQWNNIIQCWNYFYKSILYTLYNLPTRLWSSKKINKYTIPKIYIPHHVSPHKHMIWIRWQNESIHWRYHYYHNNNAIYVKQTFWQHKTIHIWSIWPNIWNHVCPIWPSIWETTWIVESVDRKTTHWTRQAYLQKTPSHVFLIWSNIWSHVCSIW